MDYTEEIFELLGIEPYEEFRLKKIREDGQSNDLYRISNDLSVEYYDTEYRTDPNWEYSSWFTIKDILNGQYEIIKRAKTFVIGDRVKVVDPSKSYTTYTNWFVRHGDNELTARYVYGHTPILDQILTIIFIDEHPSFGTAIFVLEGAAGGIFLMSREGFELEGHCET